MVHIKKLYRDAECPCDIEKERCPSCGCTGLCSEHGSYQRQMVDFVSGAECRRSLWVVRVKCASCGHTHALLSGTMIPYRKHSLIFILHVLYAHFCQNRSLSEIYAAYGICSRTFYRWKKIFEIHSGEWLGKLRFLETGIQEALRMLLDMESYACFAGAFLRRTNLTFLQSHANPANCRQALQSGPNIFCHSHNAP